MTPASPASCRALRSAQKGMYVHIVLDAMRAGFCSEHNRLGMIGEGVQAPRPPAGSATQLNGARRVLFCAAAPRAACAAHAHQRSGPRCVHMRVFLCVCVPHAPRCAVSFTSTMEADSLILIKAQEYIDQGVQKVGGQPHVGMFNVLRCPLACRALPVRGQAARAGPCPLPSPPRRTVAALLALCRCASCLMI